MTNWSRDPALRPRKAENKARAGSYGYAVVFDVPVTASSIGWFDDGQMMITGIRTERFGGLSAPGVKLLMTYFSFIEWEQHPRMMF